MTKQYNTILFNKLETLLEEKGIEFDQAMQFKFWHDPNIETIYSLIIELFEKMNIRSQEEGTNGATD